MNAETLIEASRKTGGEGREPDPGRRTPPAPHNPLPLSGTRQRGGVQDKTPAQRAHELLLTKGDQGEGGRAQKSLSKAHFPPRPLAVIFTHWILKRFFQQ